MIFIIYCIYLHRDRTFLYTNKVVDEILRQDVIKYLNGVIDHGPYARIVEKN